MTEVNPLLNSTIAGQIAQKLDAADGTKDGKINASIWNEFAQEHGGKTIKESIDVESAMNSITTYAVRGAKPAGKSVDDLAQGWLDDIKTKTPAETDNADSTEGAGSASPAEEANEAEETTPAAEDDTTEDTGNTTTNENSAKEAKAKEMGLRATNSPEFYYDEKEKMHYKWNNEKQAFEKMPGISCVGQLKEGSYWTEVKNADGSARRCFYSEDGTLTKMEARTFDNDKVYINRDYAAEKLGLRETHATKASGIYYSEKEKMHFKWNPETHAFDAMYGEFYETNFQSGKFEKADSKVGYVSADGSAYPNDSAGKVFESANAFLTEVANMNPKPEIKSGHNEEGDYDWKTANLPDGRWIDVRYDKNGEITEIKISHDTTPYKKSDGTTADYAEASYTKARARYNTNHNNGYFEGFITSGYDFEKLKAVAEKIFG